MIRSTPPPPARRRAALRLLLATALALLAHALVVGLVVLASRFPDAAEVARRARGSSRPVVLRGLTAEQWSQNRGDTSRVRDERKLVARSREEKKKKEEPRPEPTPPGQVVAVPPGNQEVDPSAKYAAETANKAAKQTVAKERTPFYRNAMPRQTSDQKLDGNGRDAVAKAQKNGNQGLGDDDRPLRSANPRAAMELPDARRRQKVDVKASESGPGVVVANQAEREEVKGNSRRLNLLRGSLEEGEEASAGRSGQPGALNLLPSPAVLDRITGAAANDHLPDVEEGEGTFLSTKEWRFASFFNRVKQSVGQQWSPQGPLRLRDPTGSIYGGRDRYTVLTITLDQGGRLKDAFVEKSSGVDFLDVEAVKAFERAQPFPNPPPGLLANDQTIRFQFGFFLELTGRPGMRLFRSGQ
jgi:TonB family protein